MASIHGADISVRDFVFVFVFVFDFVFVFVFYFDFGFFFFFYYLRSLRSSALLDSFVSVLIFPSPLLSGANVLVLLFLSSFALFFQNDVGGRTVFSGRWHQPWR